MCSRLSFQLVFCCFFKVLEIGPLVTMKTRKGRSDYGESDVTKNKKRGSKKPKSSLSSDDDDSSSDEDQEVHHETGLKKFKGLAAFNFDMSLGSPVATKPLKNVDVVDQVVATIKSEPEPVDRREEIEEKRPKGVIFRKDRQERSNTLREQSFHKLKESKDQQKFLIKSSLAPGNISNRFDAAKKKEVEVTDSHADKEKRRKSSTGGKGQCVEIEKASSSEPHATKRKKDKNSPKTPLFADDDDDEVDAKMTSAKGHGDSVQDDFQIRKEYEGEAGQRLLELKGRWGFDNRFALDERFKDEEEAVKHPADDDDGDEYQDEESGLVVKLNREEEKKQQLSILGDLLGKSYLSTPSSSTKKKKDSKATPSTTEATASSVLIKRYDPDTDPNRFDNDDDKSRKKRKKSSAMPHENEEEGKQIKVTNWQKAPPPTPPSPSNKPLLSTEPATYKTVKDLRSLFSLTPSDSSSAKSQTGTGFSILSTFGSHDTAPSSTHHDDHEFKDQSEMSSSSATPRNFWQSNPFKYDSSDEEDDTKPSVGKPGVDESAKPIKSRPGGGDRFFFRKNDPRFTDLSSFFLGKDSFPPREDYDERRRELKSIVKAKARNAKRKDEKRTMAIKRAIRKKKKYRKTMGTTGPWNGGSSNSKGGPSGGNAVKIGG